MLDLDAIEARANKATAGPWTWVRPASLYDGFPDEIIPQEIEEDFDGWESDENGRAIPDRRIICQIPGVSDFVYRTDYRHWADVHDANTDFIVHAREDVPALIGEVRQLREMLAIAYRGWSDELDAIAGSLDYPQNTNDSYYEELLQLGVIAYALGECE